jgi:hypothetical protein
MISPATRRPDYSLLRREGFARAKSAISGRLADVSIPDIAYTGRIRPVPRRPGLAGDAESAPSSVRESGRSVAAQSSVSAR